MPKQRTERPARDGVELRHLIWACEAMGLGKTHAAQAVGAPSYASIVNLQYPVTDESLAKARELCRNQTAMHCGNLGHLTTDVGGDEDWTHAAQVLRGILLQPFGYLLADIMDRAKRDLAKHEAMLARAAAGIPEPVFGPVTWGNPPRNESE